MHSRRGFLKVLGGLVAAVGLSRFAGAASPTPDDAGPRIPQYGEPYPGWGVADEQRAILAEMEKAEAYHRRFGEPEAARAVNFLVARLRERMGIATDGPSFSPVVTDRTCTVEWFVTV